MLHPHAQEFDQQIAIIKEDRFLAIVGQVLRLGFAGLIGYWVIVMALTYAMRYFGFEPNKWFYLLTAVTTLGIWTMFFKRAVSKLPPIQAAIQAVETQRAADLENSNKLYKLFKEMATWSLSGMNVEETSIHGDMGLRPFRVEHLYNNRIRGEMSGELSLGGYQFCFGNSFTGQMSGIAVPNLTEDSSILFLEDGRNTTLRVIIPSPAVVRSIFSSLIQSYLNNTRNDSPEKKAKWPNCHWTLLKFQLDDGMLRGIYHPEVVDALDLACQRRLPFEEKPRVQVKGVNIQNGLAMATALVVDGQEHVFLPTTFFRTIGERLAELIGPIPAPRALDALK